MANEEHLALLRTSVEEWDANRPETPDLRDADLRSIRLTGYDLTNADLSGASFRDATLTDIELQGARLLRTSFKNAVLSGVTMESVEASGVRLSGARLRNVSLRGATLIDSRLRATRLEGVDLRAANLTSARLGGANFTLCHLGGANISGATLQYVTFWQCTLTDLEGTPSNAVGATQGSTTDPPSWLTPERSRYFDARDDLGALWLPWQHSAPGLVASSHEPAGPGKVIHLGEGAPLGVRWPVYFATNRTYHPEAGLDQAFAGAEQDDDLTFGVASVSIPQSHRLGAGHPWMRKLLRGSEDYALRGFELLDEADFWVECATHLEPVDAYAVVFLHGYRTTFADAIIRAGQIGADLRIPLTTAFCWPSAGQSLGYFADRAAIEASETLLIDFILGLVKAAAGRRVSVIAHSMGNHGLLRAFEHIAERLQQSNGILIDQAILAAPDVDRRMFFRCVSPLSAVTNRTTLYASRRDWLVWASARVVHRGRARAGITPPSTKGQGFDTVEVQEKRILTLGHGYVASNRAFLADIDDLLRENKHPDTRFHLRRTEPTDQDPPIWFAE